MTSRLLFISDLHLEPEREDITATLLHFLSSNQGKCDALYILGDLFEVWIGDDADNPLAQRVAAALRSFRDAGAAVYLMHGNRDFLIGEDFSRDCGARLLDDPHLISTELGPVLLSHGDALCTDDTQYQQFRSMVRNPAWQESFLAKSVAERVEYARQARQQSNAATAGKAAEIMDVNEDAVLALLGENSLRRLIHGHTHRPAVHQLQLPKPMVNADQAWRLVLGDWDRQGWFAEINDGELRLQHFPLLEASAA